MLPHVDLQTRSRTWSTRPPGYTVTAGTAGEALRRRRHPQSSARSDINHRRPAAQLLLRRRHPLPAPLHVGKDQERHRPCRACRWMPPAPTSSRSSGTSTGRCTAAYFSALLARESEQVLHGSADTAAQIVADRQKSFDQGTINREAVLEAQANLASIEAKLAEAEQSKATALESLGILTGLEPSAIALATDFSTALPAPGRAGLRGKARAASTDAGRRPARRLSQARKKLAIEKGGAHPPSRRLTRRAASTSRARRTCPTRPGTGTTPPGTGTS